MFRTTIQLKIKLPSAKNQKLRHRKTQRLSGSKRRAQNLENRKDYVTQNNNVGIEIVYLLESTFGKWKPMGQLENQFVNGKNKFLNIFTYGL